MKISWLEQNALAASGVPVGLKDMESLKQQGIQAIVTLTEHPLTSQKGITPADIDKLELVIYHAPIIDQKAPDAQIVHETARFINAMKAQQKPVLLHCQAGVGRTGTMLHAYFLTQGMSLEAAKQIVKEYRPTSQYLMLSDAQKEFLEAFAATLNSNS